jgi:hypothetical protein
LAAGFAAALAAGFAAALAAGFAAALAAGFAAALAAGFAATAFFAAGLSVVVLLAVLAAGIYDSSVRKVIGRKALCLKHFHVFMRRARIVEQKNAPSARGNANCVD